MGGGRSTREKKLQSLTWNVSKSEERRERGLLANGRKGTMAAQGNGTVDIRQRKRREATVGRLRVGSLSNRGSASAFLLFPLFTSALATASYLTLLPHAQIRLLCAL